MKRPLFLYEMSTTGWYALVPPIAVGVGVPVGLLLTIGSTLPQMTVPYLDQAVGFLIPVFAAWWPSFVFRERIEGDGRELLYFHRRKGEGATALMLGLSYWLLLAPFTVIATGTDYFGPNALALLLARCMFVVTLTFFAAFVFQSGVLALILAVLVNLAVMPWIEGPLSTAVLAGSPLRVGAIGVPAVYALFSVGFLWSGEMRSRRFAP